MDEKSVDVAPALLPVVEGKEKIVDPLGPEVLQIPRETTIFTTQINGSV